MSATSETYDVRPTRVAADGAVPAASAGAGVGAGAGAVAVRPGSTKYPPSVGGWYWSFMPETSAPGRAP